MKRRRTVDLSAPIADVVKAVAKPPVAARPVFVWCGATITRQFARRPRVLRVETSGPRGSGVGENQIRFPKYGSSGECGPECGL